MGPFNAALLDLPGAVLVDDRDHGQAAGVSRFFCHPIDVICAWRPVEVPAALERIDASLASGHHVAGYLAYEAGLALDTHLTPRASAQLPIVWLGVYGAPLEMPADEIDLGPADPPDALGPLELNIGDGEYREQVRRIIDYIMAGDIYQANFTCRARFRNRGIARGLFAGLRTSHPVDHSAFINLGDAQIISISPELFLRRDGRCILTRPMKGTAPRGRWVGEDEAIRAGLGADEKNRAENLMIVDLMRNDLGRVAAIGSVRVPRLFHVEPYGTLFQMTSDVEADLGPRASAVDLIRATFPPGSVTGAPKIRAMEIIRELEREDRGVYCGSIGWFAPDGRWLLNVAIRTVVQSGGECEMGIGSGIVADSDPARELAETRLKSRFLTERGRPFSLVETLRLTPEGEYPQLSEHLARMERSARFFGWPFPDAALRAALAAEAADRPMSSAAVRLILDAAGSCSATRRIPPAVVGPVDVALAGEAVDAADRFLYHKTTRRDRYEAGRREAETRGLFDLIYQNEQGELTEGCITNLLAEMDGRRVTPALECGLLPGIWRAGLLDTGEADEGRITVDDLPRIGRIWMGNAVRGAVEVGRVLGSDGAVVWRRRGAVEAEER